jgi:Fic family protein
MDDVAFWRENGGMTGIEQTARLHHRAFLIHPFLNGNGRWARLLANIFQKQSLNTVTLWPEETVGNASVIRDEYLAAVRAADYGNYEPLIALHGRYSQK